jgi:hypothetical protein
LYSQLFPPVLRHKLVVYLLFALPFLLMILATGLNFRLIVDERRYHIHVIEVFRNTLPRPPADYGSTSAPLSYVVWALYGKVVGFEVWKLRLLTVFITYFTIYQFYLLCQERRLPFATLSAFSLLFFPYVFFFGFTIYTVSFGLFFSVLALRFYLAPEDPLRYWLVGSLFIILAIYCRQYYIAVPAGIALYRLIIKRRALVADIQTHYLHWFALALPLLAILSMYLWWGGLTPPPLQSHNRVHFVPEKLNLTFIIIGFYFMPILLKPLVTQMLTARRYLLPAIIILLPFYFSFRPVYDEDQLSDPPAAQGILMHGLDIVGDNTIQPVAELAMAALWVMGLLILFSEMSAVPWESEKTKLLCLLGAFLLVNAFTPWVLERLYDLMIPTMILLFHRSFYRRRVLLVWLGFLILLTIGYTYWQISLK